ncbi:unnamed protein product [marine sediment metagenome]|uniref:Uncharacterized protein n=1 Tax=marine sediment metagenome TaxID=412755 RepID=X1AAP3_9ZZZZ
MSDGELREWDFPFNCKSKTVLNELDDLEELSEDNDNEVVKSLDIDVKDGKDFSITFISSILLTSMEIVSNGTLTPGKLLNLAKYIVLLETQKPSYESAYDNREFISYFIYDVEKEEDDFTGKFVGLTTDYLIIKSTFTYDIDDTFESTLDNEYEYVSDEIILELSTN